LLVNYAKLLLDQHGEVFDEWSGVEGTMVAGAELDRKLDEMYEKTNLG